MAGQGNYCNYCNLRQVTILYMHSHSATCPYSNAVCSRYASGNAAGLSVVDSRLTTSRKIFVSARQILIHINAGQGSSGQRQLTLT